MHGEQPVVGFGLNQIALRRGELETNQHGEQPAEEKEEGHRRKIEQRDSFVIGRQQPRPHTIGRVQIMSARRHNNFGYAFHNELPIIEASLRLHRTAEWRLPRWPVPLLQLI